MGPILFKLGFIPAFMQFLDHSLTEYMTLFPFRALRFYLDILEILIGEICAIHPFQDNFSGGIQGATMSKGRQFS